MRSRDRRRPEAVASIMEPYTRMVWIPSGVKLGHGYAASCR